MKKPWPLGILVIAVIFVACCLWILWPRFVADYNGQANLAVPKPLENLPLSKLRQREHVTIARLQSPTIVDGFPCAASWVHFGESGHVQAFYLGETCLSSRATKFQKGPGFGLIPTRRSGSVLSR